MAVENEISQLKNKIKHEKQELSQRKQKLKKCKNDTEVAEQEMAILLHKKDACRDISAQVDKERVYFDQLIHKNHQKLARMKSEDSFLNQFEKLLKYIDKKEKVCTIKNNIGTAQEVKEAKIHAKLGILPHHAVLDDPEMLVLISERVITLYKKMQLKISNLSDLFKDYQNLIKQKQQKHDSICRSLRDKEALLAKVVQPNNDFGTIMKSFIEESDNKNASQCRGLSQKSKQTANNRSQVLAAFQNADEDHEDKTLRGMQSQNRRLLQLVGNQITSVQPEMSIADNRAEFFGVFL